MMKNNIHIDIKDEFKKNIYKDLVEAEGFENYLQVKHTGTKRFGLDGGESMIPCIERLFRTVALLGVEEVVIGMPHRGRLNVLTRIMGKPYVAVFSEFQGNSAHPDDVQGSGDVKYHLGASADREFTEGTLHLSLTANPSHLECVNPVVLGKVRAKQAVRGDEKALVLGRARRPTRLRPTRGRHELGRGRRPKERRGRRGGAHRDGASGRGQGRRGCGDEAGWRGGDGPVRGDGGLL